MPHASSYAESKFLARSRTGYILDDSDDDRTSPKWSFTNRCRFCLPTSVSDDDGDLALFKRRSTPQVQGYGRVSSPLNTHAKLRAFPCRQGPGPVSGLEADAVVRDVSLCADKMIRSTHHRISPDGPGVSGQDAEDP